MIKQLVMERHGCIIVDINTQKDLFLSNGSHCIRNHCRILEHIRRIIAWARHRYISIISICETHRENDVDHNYCIQGTNGQEKIRYTLLRSCFSFPISSETDLPINLLYHQQIILQNRYLDPFDEPRIERLLSEVQAKEFILIGASIEGAVLRTALGLLRRGKNVKVVIGALGSYKEKDANSGLRKMKVKGAKLIKAENLVGISHLQHVGICHCPICERKIVSETAVLVSQINI